jgi:hypothetical protein
MSPVISLRILQDHREVTWTGQKQEVLRGWLGIYSAGLLDPEAGVVLTVYSIMKSAH